MAKEMKMKAMILLPTGDKIRADDITAIRLGDAEPARKEYHMAAIAPRVIVDFGLNHSNCIICYCKTSDERDALAARLYREWKGAVDEVKQVNSNRPQYKTRYCYGLHRRTGTRGGIR
jgi:hypothetical protein